MRRDCLKLCMTLAMAVLPWIALCQTELTQRVSLTGAAGQANGSSAAPAISGNARYVAFQSNATNLVAGDTNGATDIFIKDLQTGEIIRIMGNGNVQPNGVCLAPSISSDGNLVAFESDASNLVANDQNGKRDVFLYDRAAGTVTLVSKSIFGGSGNLSSSTANLSVDGRFVTFSSNSTDLTASDTNGVFDIFCYTVATGTNALTSVSNAGAQADDASSQCSISSAGRYVAFRSMATNLVAGDTNEGPDIFLRDRTSSTTIRVSVATDGTQAFGNCSFPSVSTSGAIIAFSSNAATLVPDDSNGRTDIFIRDKNAQTTTCISRSDAGDQGNGDSDLPVISADGRYIVYSSFASNLVPGDTNNRQDLFVYDRSRKTTKIISLTNSGLPGNQTSGPGTMSEDATRFAFVSSASNMVSGDTNVVADIFMRQVPTTVLPYSASIDEGTLFQGNLSSLYRADDSYVKLLSDGTTLGAAMTFRGSSPVFVPSSIIVNFESSVTRTGLVLEVSAYNYSAVETDSLSSGEAQLSDELLSVALPGNVTDYLQSGMMIIKAAWQPINDEVPSQDGWLHNIDLVNWQITR